jgi:hypothetical protein
MKKIMHSKFETRAADDIDMTLVEDETGDQGETIKRLRLAVKPPQRMSAISRDFALLTVDEIEVLQGDFERYAKAIRGVEIDQPTSVLGMPWAETSKDSDFLVAQALFKSCTPTTRRHIRSAGPEGVRDLNLVTEGYSGRVRDHLIKLCWATKPSWES